MKISKFAVLYFLSAALVIGNGNAYSQGVAVNTTGTRADTCAMLDVSSATKGMLPPRMGKAQRNAIVQPATGLVIYQTDSVNGLYVNNGTPVSPNWQIALTSLTFGTFNTYSLTLPLINTFYPVVNLNTGANSNISADYTTGKITVNATGVYHFTFIATGENTMSSADFYSDIYRNGYSLGFKTIATSTGAFQYIGLVGDYLLSLNAGDWLNLEFSCNTAGGSIVPAPGGTSGATINIVQVQ